MSQKLCNVSIIFQRYMNYVLHDYIEKFYAIYLDDIAIFFNSVEEYKKNVRLILKTLKKHDIIMSMFKSVLLLLLLFDDEIKFLEHRIFSKEIQTNSAKLNKITNYPTLHSVADIRFFFEL